MKVIIVLALFAVAANAQLVSRNVEIPAWALFPRFTLTEYQEILKDQEYKREVYPNFKPGTAPQPDGAGAIRGDAQMPDPKIIGGSPATVGQFPWQVSVTMDDSFFCGGSIINSKWVLTAGHCVSGITTFRLVFGSLTPNGGASGTEAQTSRNGILHEQYVAAVIRNDIGLVEIPTALSFSSQIGAVRLPKHSDDTVNLVGMTGTISGWGKTSDAGGVSSQLNWVNLPILDNSVCVGVYGSVVTSTNICVSGENGRSTCNGDSGGPLVLQESDGIFTEVGIVSFGAAAGCELGYPLGFTRVTSYLNWIETHSNVIIRP